MKTIITLFIVAILIGIFLPIPMAHAQVKEAGEAGKLASGSANEIFELERDERTIKLEAYLRNVKSPMLGAANAFVKYADKYNLDWKLVAAIAGLESSFGKRIPYNSYNAWGWAVYTGKSYGAEFDSWEHGIATVSEGLRKNYYNDGLTTLEAIGRRYAASPTWAVRVSQIMTRLETPKLDALAIQINL